MDCQWQRREKKSIGNGFIVIGLRSVGKSNVWFDLTETDNQALLKQSLLSIPPCHVQGGVVLFAISNLENPQEKMPLPEEFKNIINENKEFEKIEISTLVDKIWPSEISVNEKKELLKLINEFKKDLNFSQENLHKYSDIITYAVESDLLKIGVDSSCWPVEISQSEYGSMFLLAYICGNMEKQLISENYVNSPEEGIQLEVMKYKQLKKIDNNIKFSFFESLIE